MKYLRLMRGALAILAVFVVLGSASISKADFTYKVTVQEDNGTVQTFTGSGQTFSNGGVSVQTPDLTITFVAASSAASNPTNANIQLSASFLSNSSASAHTLNLDASFSGYTAPASPPALTLADTFSGTVASGGITAGTLVGAADATGALLGTGFTDSALNLSSGAVGANKSFSQNGTATTGFNTSGVYSLTLDTSITVAGNSSLSFSANESGFNATPAPSNIVLALLGASLSVVWVYGRRKLFAAAQN